MAQNVTRLPGTPLVIFGGQCYTKVLYLAIRSASKQWTISNGMGMENGKLNFKIKVLIPITAISAAFILIVSFIHYRMLESAVEAKTNENLDVFVGGISAEISHLNIILDTTKHILSEKHIAIAKSIAHILNNAPNELTLEQLQQLAEPLDIIELNIANRNGIITKSSVPKYVGFDYKLREVTAKYMALVDGTISELSEEPRESEFDDDIPGEINHYVGIAREGGFIQVGFDATVIGRLRNEVNIKRTIKETRIGNNGYGMVLQEGVIIAHPDDDLLGRDVSNESWYRDLSSSDGFAWTEIDGEAYYARYKDADSVIIIGLVSEGDYHRELHYLRAATLWLLLPVIALMGVIVYFVLGRLFRPLREMTATALDLANGKPVTVINLRSKDEFGVLADSFRYLTQTIEGIMTDIQAMTKRHSEGDYEYLIATDSYKGSYKDMAAGINGMMLMTVDELKTIISYLENLKGGGQIDKIKRFPGKKAVISDTIDDLVGKVHFDILTGIYNRRYMEETLNSVIKTMQRSGGGKLSVMMLDIDFFKVYNDTYGHTEGDNCLRSVAKAIEDSVTRDDDFAARYGGEEFTVVLPNTDKDGVRAIAERVLENVRKRNIPHEKSAAAPCVTVSIGVVTGDVKIMKTALEYIKRSDEALYVSKENGRNRVTFCDVDIDESPCQ